MHLFTVFLAIRCCIAVELELAHTFGYRAFFEKLREFASCCTAEIPIPVRLPGPVVSARKIVTNRLVIDRIDRVLFFEQGDCSDTFQPGKILIIIILKRFFPDIFLFTNIALPTIIVMLVCYELTE